MSSVPSREVPSPSSNRFAILSWDEDEVEADEPPEPLPPFSPIKPYIQYLYYV